VSRLEVLVIGYGSIGARHARLVDEMGHGVAVVSRRAGVAVHRCYTTIESAVGDGGFSHAIVANETSQHWQSVQELRHFGFAGPILVEKPLVAGLHLITSLRPRLPEPIWVAYNLRFHPALQLLKSRLASEQAISATLLAGQDLHSWRPDRTLAESYSSDPSRGGGVLRDLSHELDLFLWLFGPWSRLAALGGHVGPLPIAADDCWSVIVSGDKCPMASIQLDYYNRQAVRQLIVNTHSDTFTIDLVGHVYRDGRGERRWELGRDHTYVAQLRSFLGHDELADLCSLDEALGAVAMIEAVEAAASSRTWIAA
jgi:predicted dehydrogenase